MCSKIATTQSRREGAFAGKCSEVDCDGDNDASEKDTLRHRTDLPYVILKGLYKSAGPEAADGAGGPGLSDSHKTLVIPG